MGREPELDLGFLSNRWRPPSLIKDITGEVVKNFNVGADAVLVEVVETSRDKAKDGVLFSGR